MQSIQLCVRVIFCFCHAQQIVRGHAVELCQRDNAERAERDMSPGEVNAMTGFPQNRKILWEEEEQRNERAFMLAWKRGIWSL